VGTGDDDAGQLETESDMIYLYLPSFLY
jgi:hypothetical protein